MAGESCILRFVGASSKRLWVRRERERTGVIRVGLLKACKNKANASLTIAIR